MKRFFLLALVLVTFSAVYAQQDPVEWHFTGTPKGAGTYLIKIQATVHAPWHIYSQFTPAGGPVPTSFSFGRNPLVTLSGKVSESGKMHHTHDKNFGVDVRYYDGSVLFAQLVKVKKGAKTNLNGTVEYMVCNDRECLPPAKKSFSVRLQ